MMKPRRLVILLGVLLIAGAQPAAARPLRAGCGFAHGFAALAARIPADVGQCTGDEQFNPATGMTSQHTTRGVLTWRKGLNITSFTDATHTWILGAHGLHMRLTTALFDWEQKDIVGENVGDGQLAALPEGALRVAITAVSHPAGSSITLTQQAGFVYAITGTLTIQGGQDPSRTVAAGKAAFVDPALAYTVGTPRGGPATWYLFSVRRAALPAPSLGAGATSLYTADLPPLAAGAYTVGLRPVVIQVGGRGAAHKHGGIEVLYITQGAVKVRLAGQAAMVMPAGQGMYHTPYTAVQEINAGSVVAHELAFFITAAGQPFRRDVDYSP